MLLPERPASAPASPHPLLRVTRIGALPEDFALLAADATADGHRMLEVLREDWDAGEIRFGQPGEALFAAHVGQALVGLCGLTRDPYLKTAEVGRIRRLYVHRAARRAGAGRALVEAVVAAAAAHGYPRLRVRAPAEAFAFYAACGFLRAVGEPGATHTRQLTGDAP